MPAASMAPHTVLVSATTATRSPAAAPPAAYGTALTGAARRTKPVSRSLFTKPGGVSVPASTSSGGRSNPAVVFAPELLESLVSPGNGAKFAEYPAEFEPLVR